MHILYFHQHFSTRKGTSGTRSFEMAQALLRHGHSVTMVCGSYAHGQTGLSGPFTKGIRRGLVDGIDVIELELDYSNNMSYTKRVLVFAKFALVAVFVALREPADTIFATTTPLTAGIPGIVARWLRRIPFVFEVRDLWPELPKAMGVIKNPVLLWLMSILEWISYYSADRLIGLSPGIIEGIAARGVPKDSIAMIPNGCDLELFIAQKETWRPEGVNEQDLLAIFTGTHGIANGLDAVLDAATILKERKRDDIRIALVGQGGEKEVLVSRVRQENLDNVLFLNPIAKIQLTKLLAGADIGLQVLRNIPAFYYGTSPNKFFDYIAAGLPVLNNYPGWLADLIKVHNCGIVVEPEDAKAFADELEYAQDHRNILKIKGQNAASLAKQNFSRIDLSAQWVSWVTGQSCVSPNKVNGIDGSSTGV